MVPGCTPRRPPRERLTRSLRLSDPDLVVGRLHDIPADVVERPDLIGAGIRFELPEFVHVREDCRSALVLDRLALVDERLALRVAVALVLASCVRGEDVLDLRR